MKKLLSLVLVLTLALTISACGNKQVGMANPMVEKDSLKGLNEVLGTDIKAYDKVDEDSESYFYIDGVEMQISQYTFNANEVKYTLRAAKTESDISGVYLTDFQDGTMGDTISEKEVMPTETADGYLWARWYDGDIQYFLEASDVTLEDFTKVYEIVK